MNDKKTTKETITKEAKKTRGKIEGFSRDIWVYMEKTPLKQQMLHLKAAVSPAKVNSIAANLIRIFDSDVAKEKGIPIEDYESLNEHPELILYEGYKVRGRGGEFTIEKRNEAGTSILERKINEGTITDVGVIIEKTVAERILSGFGHFLMMGGFLVVFVVILGIYIAITLLFKGC